MSWLDNVELHSVLFNRLEAKVEPERRAERPTSLALIPAAPLYRRTVLGLDVRAAIHVELRDPDDEAFATLGAEVVANFSAPGSADQDEPTDAELDEFASSIATRVSFPYLREAIQSLAVRCGMQEVVFSLVSDSGMFPGSLRLGERRLEPQRSNQRGGKGPDDRPDVQPDEA